MVREVFEDKEQENIFIELLVDWAEFEQTRQKYNQKIRKIAKKAGISQQVISYHLQKRKQL